MVRASRLLSSNVPSAAQPEHGQDFVVPRGGRLLARNQRRKLSILGEFFVYRPHSWRSPFFTADGPYQSSAAQEAAWEAIEILFLSDERVQIRNGAHSETRNYAEFGFADRRNESPNQAWKTLRALAAEGVIRNAKEAGVPWPKVEKQIQEIRKVLRKHFGISADPVPFVKDLGYKACFKIGLARSFDT